MRLVTSDINFLYIIVWFVQYSVPAVFRNACIPRMIAWEVSLTRDQSSDNIFLNYGVVGSQLQSEVSGARSGKVCSKLVTNIFQSILRHEGSSEQKAHFFKGNGKAYAL